MIYLSLKHVKLRLIGGFFVGKYNPLFCKWCKKEIEGKGWSDGPNRYCDHRCFSAQTFWVYVVISLFIVPFTILMLVYPNLLIYVLFRTTDDPFAIATEPILAMLYVAGFLVAMILATIGFSYSAYVGFIERRNMKKQDELEQPHTQYFD